MSEKPHLSGSVQSCVSTLGWWYFLSESGREMKTGGMSHIYGPFSRRDDARNDRRARLKTIKHLRYRVPFIAPIRAKASVRVENGVSVWRRDGF